MEIRHLRYFVAVAEESHFGRAADRLFISQPPLSQQIRQLESEFGAVLFVRDPRGVRLTDAGRRLLPEARLALQQVERAQQAVEAFKPRSLPTLRVGLAPLGAGELTARLLAAFHRRFPLVELELHDTDHGGQADALVAGRIDVALVRQPLRDARIALTPLCVEPRVVVVPVLHPLARAASANVADLCEENFCPLAGPPEWVAFWQLATERGATSSRSSAGPRASTVPQINETVALGSGVTTLPASVEQFFPHPLVRCVPLADAVGSALAVAHHVGMPSALIDVFLATARTVVGGDAQPARRAPLRAVLTP